MRKKDLLSSIRNGVKLSNGEKISLALRLSMPAMLAQITSIVMQYIDASMVGRLGSDASASIGLVATTTWLFGSVTSSAAAGFSIQVAQEIGAKNYKRARQILQQSYVVVFAVALVLALAGAAISGRLPYWLGGDSRICQDASRYFLVYAWMLLPMALNGLAGSMLQCSGNMKVPGILNSCMCILDVVFNMFFIFPSRNVSVCGIRFTLPGAGLGVMGAALGTACAETVIMCIMQGWLIWETPLLHRRKDEEYRMEAACIKRAARLALPIGFEHFVVCLAMVITTKIVAPLGVVAIAANSFAVTAESLCYMPGYGIADAATTLTGQSVGAGRGKLALSFGRITVGMGMLLMAATGALMYAAAPFMIGLLSPDPAVRELGTQILRIEAFAEPLYGASIVVAGALRGAGDTLIPSILNLVSLWGVRLPLSCLLAGRLGLQGVWIAMAVELCFRGAIFLIRMFRKRWLKDMKGMKNG